MTYEKGARVEFFYHRLGWIRATVVAVPTSKDDYYEIDFDEVQTLLGERWAGTRVWPDEDVMRPLGLLERMAEESR